MDIGAAVAKHNHSIDHWGVAIDERVSDLQKRIRQGDAHGSMFTFFCGFNMPSMFPGNKTALAIQTNFTKRLLVIAVEDVGLANPWLVKSILPHLLSMIKDRHARDAGVLAQIVKDLADSHKSRLCSHMYHAYHPMNAKQAAEAGLSLEPARTFADPACFAWISVTDPNELIAKAIKSVQHIDGVYSTFNALKMAYGLASEKSKSNVLRYIVGLAHMLNVEGDAGDYVRADMACLNEYQAKNFSKSYLRALVTSDPSLEVEVLEESVDIHTKRGKRMKRTVVDFRTEGALVHDEHPLLRSEVMLGIYLNSLL